MLAQNPDLVLIEFCVNDGDGDRSESMEKMVHKTWMKNPKTDLVIFYTMAPKHLDSYKAGKLPPSASAPWLRSRKTSDRRWLALLTLPEGGTTYLPESVTSSVSSPAFRRTLKQSDLPRMSLEVAPSLSAPGNCASR
ncbi:MAG: hypothetical protein WCJ14_00850 [Verrucomicrobiota bacterium]